MKRSVRCGQKQLKLDHGVKRGSSRLNFEFLFRKPLKLRFVVTLSSQHLTEVEFASFIVTAASRME